ncbi:MAG: pentapeptide repeat-containing protein [Ferrovibrio sp.]
MTSAVPPSGSENRVSQAELDRIVVRHQFWLDRKTGGALANFSGRDLSGLKFGRWDLRHASFAGAHLSGIHVTDTRFCYCDFTAADLSGARTFDCDFRYTRFKRARLVGAEILDTRDDWPIPVGDEELWYCGGGVMDADMDEADLRSAKIHVELSSARLETADWRSADLRDEPNMDWPSLR